jgi:mono/diheme cytochrome c family protein
LTFRKSRLAGVAAVVAATWSVVLGATLASRPPSAGGTQNQTSTPAAVRDEGSPALVRDAIDQYCITCHSARMKSGGLVLEAADLSAIGANAEQWERVLAKLRTHEMPPPQVRRRPDAATHAAITSFLETALDREADAHPNPGRVVLHRLNRAEYANAVRDLLGVEVDARALLPGDDADRHGFENIAGTLSVSPALLERYVAAAKMVSRLAVGDPETVPVFDTYRTPKMVTQDDRAGEELPFGSRGGLAVRHWFPVDAEYVLRVRLKRQLYDYIIGIGRPHRIEIRVDRQRVAQFTVGGEAKGTPAPYSFAGNLLAGAAWETYMHEADAGLEVRVPVTSGPHHVAVSFLDAAPAAEGILQPDQTGFDRAVNELYDGQPEVDSLAIGGPYNVKGLGNSPSRRRIFSCHPAASADEESCARSILTSVVRRAYRRAPSSEDIETAFAFYRRGRAEGTFDTGIRRALERVLAGPDFLFRIERDPAGVAPGTSYQVSSVELASRLSFFLWSSIPDEELLTAAIDGTLRDPQVLDRQVQRMLADARSQALVGNFATQWLELNKLRGFSADPDAFPEFDDGIKSAMRTETELFIGDQIAGDQDVLQLLTANYTFLNERLARHYGVKGVYGSRFRKVPLQDQRRGGLLGQASVLALTSYPNRTSPVLRGKWVLDNILGTPPPPPPPDVPGLKDTGANGRPASARELMEQHRKDPACAGCHVRMDPLGFALENYDAIGRWRAESDGGPVDAKGTLPDGTVFDGLGGLRTLMAAHHEDFALTVTRKLMTYGLGREVEYYDLPAVRRVVHESAGAGYRWSAIISAIVRSVPFQMRRSDS